MAEETDGRVELDRRSWGWADLSLLLQVTGRTEGSVPTSRGRSLYNSIRESVQSSCAFVADPHLQMQRLEWCDLSWLLSAWLLLLAQLHCSLLILRYFCFDERPAGQTAVLFISLDRNLDRGRAERLPIAPTLRSTEAENVVSTETFSRPHTDQRRAGEASEVE